MSDVINKWLTETLGIIVEIYSETFARLIQNGYLVGAILRHYNIINAGHLTTLTLINDPIDAINKIAIWLEQIDIRLDDETKKQLEKGKVSTALELLYRLYVVFQGSDPLHYTAKHIRTENLRDITTERFEVTPVVVEKPDPSEVPPHPLSSLLSDYKHVVQWHRERYNVLMQRCEQLRKCYDEFMEKRLQTDLAINFRPLLEKKVLMEELVRDEDLLSLNESYEELMKQEAKAQGQGPLIPDVKVAKKIVKNIKKKYDKERVDVAFQSRMETMVLAHFWDDLLQAQSKRIDANISEKMLKQSYYEKQMTNTMFKMREQKEIMTENRLNVLKEIQKKKDAELLERMFAKEKKSSDGRYRFYFERDRVLELHTRIYAEKKRLSVQRKLDMCESVLEDMIDIGIRRAQYKEEFEEDMHKRIFTDLASLFIHNQPIFDLVPNEEVIIEYEPVTDAEEEIYLEEIDRQNAMDIQSFERYCNYEWPWELEVHVPNYAEENILIVIEMAMNILGHVIFRLLLEKYPKPPLKPPPDIPKVHAAVCINSISDLTILPILDKLLSERQIKVIQMEEAINYCLGAYKDETTAEYPESQFIDETQDALEKKTAGKAGKKSKTEKKEIKRKGEKKGKKKAVVPDENDSFIAAQFLEKQIQTPKIFPNEEPVLTPQGQLGRVAYEILELGEGLSDEVLVQMFVEYLKSLKDIDGWCLINYPSNIVQMRLLEEALNSRPIPLTADFPINKTLGHGIAKSGCSVKNNSSESFGLTALFSSKPVLVEGLPQMCSNRFRVTPTNDEDPLVNNKDDAIEDMANLDYREVKQNHIVEDPNATHRVSRILRNPDLPETIDDYDCYLTAYIKIIQDMPSQKQLEAVDENLDDLDTFYQNQGCLYSLYYKVFDLATIKHIGKLIIGDYTIPPKSSIQIFGEAVLFMENNPNLPQPFVGNVSKSKSGGPKKEKASPVKMSQKQEIEAEKTGKKEKKGKKGEKLKDKKPDKKKGKKGKEEEEEKPDVIIVKIDKETQFPEPPPEVEDIVATPEPNPLPGGSNWQYVDLPIPSFLQVALATLWENVEEIYVCDFRELFFRRRVLWKTVMPYLNFVKKYMRDFIDRPDDKQIHLYTFQKIYNEIAADMRDDDEVKAELHCRIQEFREKLWEICDNRMKESEREREIVVTKDWTAKQTCELTNVYITAMQLEIDRTADTLQLLNDYYVGMITKMPCGDDVMEKQLLKYLTFKDDFEFENYQNFSSFVRKSLMSGVEIVDVSPYHKLILENHQDSMKAARNYKNKSLSILAGMEGYFQLKGKKGKAPKDAKGKSKGKAKLPKFSGPDPEVKEVGMKLISEWQCAIEGEFARVGLRLDLLKSVSHEDIRDMLISSVKTFRGLYNDIKDRYDKEVESVKECCDVLSRAVEEEMAIQPELVLKGDKFYVNPDVLLFADPLPGPEPIMKEFETPGVFTIVQLSQLTDILCDLAPSGIMPERAFTFLLQDIIVNNAEDGRPSLVPELWKKLHPRCMNRLSFEFFGQVELIDWKDFIIYNLCVEFPNESQLMQIRRQFREFDVDLNEYVYDYQFDTIRFWFESQFDLEDPQQALRFGEMKYLLFKLYRIDDNRVNYTAMLLAFCKDTEAHLGLAKALALSLGKLVCYDVEIGNAFVTILRQKQLEKLQDEMRLKMMERAKIETVEGVMDDLIDVTVHQCDSCYLESYHSSNSTGNDVNSKEELQDQELVYLENLINEYETKYSYEECEENATQFLQEQFSNVEIGFEPEYYPSKVYYLIFEVLLTVAVAAMPWQAISKNDGEPSFRQTLENLYNSCKNPEFEDIVLMHEFLNNDSVKQLFGGNFKFVIRKSMEIIDNLIECK